MSRSFARRWKAGWKPTGRSGSKVEGVRLSPRSLKGPNNYVIGNFFKLDRSRVSLKKLPNPGGFPQSVNPSKTTRRLTSAGSPEMDDLETRFLLWKPGFWERHQKPGFQSETGFQATSRPGGLTSSRDSGESTHSSTSRASRAARPSLPIRARSVGPALCRVPHPTDRTSRCPRSRPA